MRETHIFNAAGMQIPCLSAFENLLDYAGGLGRLRRVEEVTSQKTGRSAMCDLWFGDDGRMTLCGAPDVTLCELDDVLMLGTAGLDSPCSAELRIDSKSYMVVHKQQVSFTGGFESIWTTLSCSSSDVGIMKREWRRYQRSSEPDAPPPNDIEQSMAATLRLLRQKPETVALDGILGNSELILRSNLSNSDDRQGFYGVLATVTAVGFPLESDLELLLSDSITEQTKSPLSFPHWCGEMGALQLRVERKVAQIRRFWEKHGQEMKTLDQSGAWSFNS